MPNSLSRRYAGGATTTPVRRVGLGTGLKSFALLNKFISATIPLGVTLQNAVHYRLNDCLHSGSRRPEIAHANCVVQCFIQSNAHIEFAFWAAKRIARLARFELRSAPRLFGGGGFRGLQHGFLRFVMRLPRPERGPTQQFAVR